MRSGTFTNQNLENIKAGFFKKIGSEQSENKSTAKKSRYAAGLILAAALALSLGIGALASSDMLDMSAVYRAFLGAGSENAGFNINNSFEKDGIELKLLSAVVDGNNGYVFFTLQDLEGDRLNENMGWGYTNVGFRGLFKGHILDCSVEQLGYDAATKTISAVIRMKSTKGISVKDKMTFTVGRLESGVEFFDNFETGIDIYSLLAEREAAEATTEYGGNVTGHVAPIGFDLTREQVSKLPLLKKNALDISVEGIDSVIISNIGFIDGKLHIQYQNTEKRRDFNGAYFSLYGQDGEEIQRAYSVYIEWVNYGGYEEHVYDISSAEELEGVSLKARFSTSKEYIEGPWALDFEVGSQAEEKTIKLDSLKNVALKKVTITASSISTTIKFSVDKGDEDENFEKVKVVYENNNYLKLRDGGIIKLKFTSGSLDHERNQGDIVYYNDFYEMEALESIILNEIEYNF